MTLYELRFTRDDQSAFSRLTAVWTGATTAASALPNLATPLRELPEDVLTAFRFAHPSARWSAAQLRPLQNAAKRQIRIRR